ncbi:MAG: hypothetical protein FJ100_20775 [Deltaproteobacteria bacterium]|nr:hypothetical protein [Deltaproteobacteria bacterium]
MAQHDWVGSSHRYGVGAVAFRGPPGTFDDDVDATPSDNFDGVDDPVGLDWAA